MGKRPIAIIDSGVGGLTVVKELQSLLPKENLIYFGDNKNVPYGSKSREEIVILTKKMLDFLMEKDVKLIGIGCNTISTVLNLIAPQYDVKIIGIIDPVVNYIAKLTNNKVGLIATPFTAKSGYYNLTLSNFNKNIEIVAEGCPKLASLIDSGIYTKDEVKEEIAEPMAQLNANHALDTIILGCTHYAIITDHLQKLYPDTVFINPALYQALAIKKYLTEHDMLNVSEGHGDISVFTTGATECYQRFLAILGITGVSSINKVE
ncbi:MAG: hypothetical protein VR72_17355 [Clostridiaceae bacterium BRH_c20a]|nr:MAG: hypothetical protein VR72_17355 [Clostridiaceae bacterium BRH_c20a]